MSTPKSIRSEKSPRGGSELYRRLEAIRRKLGLNKSEFARTMGYAIPSYKPSLSPGAAELGRILLHARREGVAVDELWLLLGEGVMEAREVPARFPRAAIGLPSLGRRDPAGFRWPRRRGPSESVTVPASLHRPWRFALVAGGDAMAPAVESGDTCIFDRRESIQDGDLILVRLCRGRGPEQALLRRWHDHGSAVELRPERPSRELPPLLIYRRGQGYLAAGRAVSLVAEGVLVHIERPLRPAGPPR